MNENVSKVQEKINEVSELIEMFGSQSEQVNVAQIRLDKATKTFEKKLDEIVQSDSDR